MPDAEAQTPAAEAPQQASPAAPSPEPASSGTSGLRPFSLGRALGLADTPPPASSEDTPAAPPADAPTPDDKPASEEAPTPSEAPGDGAPEEPEQEKLSRRARAAEENRRRIAELEAEVASLKSATEASPEADLEQQIEQAREQARAEERERLRRERDEEAGRQEQEALAASERADAERFERLNALPDDHPTLAEGDNWQWLQERKRLLSQFPQAERLIKSQAARYVEEARARDAEALEKDKQAFWANVLDDMATARQVPGVDFEAVRAAKTFAERDQILYAAGAASRDAEVAERDTTITTHEETIARLEDEIRDLRLVGPRGLAARRAPTDGGRSGGAESGASAFDETRGWRQNLAAALAPSNGR